MKNWFNFLKALANVGIVIYLVIIFGFSVAFFDEGNILQAIFFAAILAANIWLAVKANSMLNKIEVEKGAKMAIFYLFVGLLLFAFLNFGLCVFSIGIRPQT